LNIQSWSDESPIGLGLTEFGRHIFFSLVFFSGLSQAQFSPSGEYRSSTGHNNHCYSGAHVGLLLLHCFRINKTAIAVSRVLSRALVQQVNIWSSNLASNRAHRRLWLRYFRPTAPSPTINRCHSFYSVPTDSTASFGPAYWYHPRVMYFRFRYTCMPWRIHPEHCFLY
jgi:hypothetical protein